MKSQAVFFLVVSKRHNNRLFPIILIFLEAAPNYELPPSYEEVVNLPNQYPKRTQSTENLEAPPPTIAEIEALNSITTITQHTPAIITQHQHFQVHPERRAASSVT